MSKDKLQQLDRDHLIHSVTNFRAHERNGVSLLERGDGVYLFDADGNKLLDAFSGLWCVNVGYGQQSIVEAAAEQMSRLPYATTYFDFGSEPAILLAAKLADRAPDSLNHVYFTQGGSDSVDSAIRYITHYFNALGQPQKKQFIALERGYHGTSSIGAGLTGLPAFHTNFDVPHSNQHHIPSPYPYRHESGDDPAALIASSVQSLRDKVAELGSENVAAFFCEPVQGSGGVIVPPCGWLKAISEACTDLGILLVADEVITAFGRTGPLFASAAEDVEPDIITVAKGLTAGYAPMGAMLFSSEIYDTIADSDRNGAVVGHGSTYSAHPVSAAIGLEVLRLYEEGGLLANGDKISPLFEQGLQDLRQHPLVGDARQRGLLGALELVANKTTKSRFDVSLKLSDRIQKKAYQNGIIFRTFADNILGFAPALCYSESEMELLFERLRKTLDDVLSDSDVRANVA
jgi:adenosylmethionine-8-amino-7-oxononanoate aminotransferase